MGCAKIYFTQLHMVPNASSGLLEQANVIPGDGNNGNCCL